MRARVHLLLPHTPSVPLSPRHFRLIADLSLLAWLPGSKPGKQNKTDQNVGLSFTMCSFTAVKNFVCRTLEEEEQPRAVGAVEVFMGEAKMQRFPEKHRGGFLPDTSDIFNNPDRRAAPTTPAVLITPDISTSSSGCRGRTVWRGHDSSWQGDCRRVGGVSLCETINGGF